MSTFGISPSCSGSPGSTPLPAPQVGDEVDVAVTIQGTWSLGNYPARIQKINGADLTIEVQTNSGPGPFSARAGDLAPGPHPRTWILPLQVSTTP